jgi:hypothetical protein
MDIFHNTPLWFDGLLPMRLPQRLAAGFGLELQVNEEKLFVSEGLQGLACRPRRVYQKHDAAH